METAHIGPLTVSRLCLGTMLMGDKTPPEESHRMLDRFVAAGGNFIDTADTYIDGESERTLAPWLAQHRDEVAVATKVRFAVSDPGGEGLAPDRIRAACDASLKRLGIDVIDLYQVHAPDPSVPLEETTAALGDSPRWFQLYWSTSDELVESFVSRAERSGCEAIVVTLDTTLLGWRTRDLDIAYLPFLRGKGIAQYTSDPVFRRLMREPSGARRTALASRLARAWRCTASVPPMASVDAGATKSTRSPW